MQDQDGQNNNNQVKSNQRKRNKNKHFYKEDDGIFTKLELQGWHFLALFPWVNNTAGSEVE